LHLRGPQWTLPVRGRQPERLISRNRRTTPGERSPHRFDQNGSVKLKLASQVIQVEEILDATIPIAVDNHRFELLRDHRLTRVDQYFGGGQVEQCWKSALRRRRPHAVTSTHVNLERQSSGPAGHRQ